MITLTPEQLAGYQAKAPATTVPASLLGSTPAQQASNGGYGGAVFGGGGGGDNRYDYTQWGGGLYSIGIDPGKAGFQNDVMSWYNSQPDNVKAEVDSYWKNNQKTGDAAFDMANAVDWRQRDVARKIQIEHGMFDFLGPLAPLGSALVTAAGTALGGPIGGALAGGIVGGIQGGPLGGILGAAGGYYGGGLLGKLGVPTNVLGLPGGGSVSGLLGTASQAPLSSINQFFPADIAARAGTSTAGNLAPLTNVNQFFPDDIAARAATGGLAPIVDHSVALATNTPPGVFEASKDLLSQAINPSNLASSAVKNLATNAVGSLLSPDPAASAGGALMPQQGNTWSVNPYTKSPYPELLRPQRMSIRNQLVM